MPRRRVRFHEVAEAELDAAAAWYDQQRQGLGGQLITAIGAKITAILETPVRWPRVGRTRRALVGRFPYSIVYRELSHDEIEIVAVAHARRRPGYWRRR